MHYIGFYTIYYIENISFSIIYAVHSAETNSIFKYSLVTFVCLGFWFAILFQFIYYRFLHPSDHVRINTKHNLAVITRIRPIPRINRMKKSKSCEEMIDQNELQTVDLHETMSIQLNNNEINERWHNRFSKENRQKLLSQQQAIDQKVKLTRAQKHLEDSSKRQAPIRTKFSTGFHRSTSNDHPDTSTETFNTRRSPFFNVTRVPLTRSSHPESYAKMQQEDDDDDEIDHRNISYISDKHSSSSQPRSNMYNIDEDTTISNTNGEEMILTAAKLTPIVLSTSTNPMINTSRC